MMCCASIGYITSADKSEQPIGNITRQNPGPVYHKMGEQKSDFEIIWQYGQIRRMECVFMYISRFQKHELEI